MKPKVLYFIPALVWFIIIFILLVMPGSDVPSVPFLEEIQFDKLVHAGMFGVQTMLVCFPFFGSKYASKLLFLKIALAAVVYGVGMEFVQKYFTVDRDCDVWDMLADSAGAFIGLAIVNFWYKKYLKKQQAI